MFACLPKKKQSEPPYKGGSGEQKNRLRFHPKSGGSAILYLSFNKSLQIYL